MGGWDIFLPQPSMVAYVVPPVHKLDEASEIQASLKIWQLALEIQEQ